MKDVQELNKEIGLYKTELEKYKKLFMQDGQIDEEEQNILDDLLEKIIKVKYKLDELMLEMGFSEDDSNRWRTLIMESSIQSVAIKNKLIEVTKELPEGEENEEKLNACIEDIVAFESRTDLLDLDGKTLKPENHIRLILKVIRDKNDFISIYDLNGAHSKYLEGKLKLGPDKFENPNGLGTGFKIVPFNNEILQKLIKGNREDDKSLFSKTGKLVWVGHKYPIRIKVSIQPFSLNLALTSNTLTDAGDNWFYQAARNTTSFSGKSMSSAITMASGGIKFDFGWFIVSGKIDLLKFGSETSLKLDDMGGTSSGKFELAAVVFQANFGDKQFDLLAQKIGDESLFKGQKEKITASLKINASFDAFAYSTRKIEDAGEKKAIKDLAKMSKEAVKHTDEMIANVVSQKPRKVSKESAKRLKIF